MRDLNIINIIDVDFLFFSTGFRNAIILRFTCSSTLCGHMSISHLVVYSIHRGGQLVDLLRLIEHLLWLDGAWRRRPLHVLWLQN